MEDEDDIIFQLEMFRYFGIPEDFTYKESVDELIRLYTELLQDKIRRDKHDFRQNLYNIQKIQN